MKRILICIFIPCAFAHAQQRVPQQVNAGVSGGAMDGIQTVALSADHIFGLFKSNRLQAGYGIRYTSLFEHQRDYVSGSGASTVRTKLTENTQHVFNLTFTAQYIADLFTNRKIPVLIGLNIDLGGLTIGNSRPCVISYDDPSVPNADATLEPMDFNLLLGNYNDIGFLNSEFFLGYPFTPRLTVKAGFSHFYTQYKANLPAGTNLYFARFTNLVLLNVSYRVY